MASVPVSHCEEGLALLVTSLSNGGVASVPLCSSAEGVSFAKINLSKSNKGGAAYVPFSLREDGLAFV